MSGPALLTSKEVAAQLSVSQSTLSRWRDFKLGPEHVNLAGITRYRAEDVQAYIEDSRA